jgi:hypothetical protein
MTLNYKAIGEMIMTSREEAMYGMSTEDIKEQYMAIGRMTGLEMVVAGVLSDCQEMLAHMPKDMAPIGRDRVRKQLNVAKFILFEMMDQKESV